MIISRTTRAFEVKWRTFFLASQVVPFRHTKQASKNVVDTNFNHLCTYRSVINDAMISLSIATWFNSSLLLCNTACDILRNNFWCHSISKFFNSIFWYILMYRRYNVYSVYIQDKYAVVVIVLFNYWAQNTLSFYELTLISFPI